MVQAFEGISPTFPRSRIIDEDVKLGICGLANLLRSALRQLFDILRIASPLDGVLELGDGFEVASDDEDCQCVLGL